MSGHADPGLVAATAAAIFERLNISYLVGGSLASTLFGEPRSTFDVDFVADIAPQRADELARELAHEFHVDIDSVREAARDKRMFNAIHTGSYVKLDVHVRAPVGHFAAELARARSIEFAPGLSARFATAEDVVVKKLWWYRRGDEVSDRQWRDVLGVLRSMGERFDFAYSEHWAQELGVADLLQRAIVEAGGHRAP